MCWLHCFSASSRLHASISVDYFSAGRDAFYQFINIFWSCFRRTFNDIPPAYGFSIFRLNTPSDTGRAKLKRIRRTRARPRARLYTPMVIFKYQIPLFSTSRLPQSSRLIAISLSLSLSLSLFRETPRLRMRKVNSPRVLFLCWRFKQAKRFKTRLLFVKRKKLSARRIVIAITEDFDRRLKNVCSLLPFTIAFPFGKSSGRSYALSVINCSPRHPPFGSKNRAHGDWTIAWREKKKREKKKERRTRGVGCAGMVGAGTTGT